jgi:hypothetical protein
MAYCSCHERLRSSARDSALRESDADFSQSADSQQCHSLFDLIVTANISAVQFLNAKVSRDRLLKKLRSLKEVICLRVNL